MKRLFVALLLPALAACSSHGSGSGDTLTVGSSPTAAAPGTTQGPAVITPSVGCVNGPSSGPAPAGATTSLSQKPVVRVPAGPPPCGLQVLDIVTGNGPAAQAGQQLTVKYVGVLYSDGSEFDSSWKRGATTTFPFHLGAHEVINGWDQGIAGMKVGGRRELVIPPALGYGPDGSPPVIPPSATLIFVVDLVKIG